MENLSKVEAIIGYKFKDKNMVSIAIVHPGARKFDKNYSRSFEKLEFLGDKVLGLSLSSLIFAKFQEDSEGDLSVRISTLAGTDFLINLAKKTKLISCFSYPKDLFVSKNKTSSSIADMVEAVLGSVFLDSDFTTVRDIVARLWDSDIDKVVYKEKDPKTRLQEIVQCKSGNLPVYRLVKMSGEAHDPIFEMEVSAEGVSATGFGNSKKSAEHDAAEKLIAKLDK